MQTVDKQYLETLKPGYIKKGYQVPKWIQFCEAMIDLGFTVELHRAKTTVSKYIYITKGDKNMKIRFSNHKANYHKEQDGDCDYYVGVGNNGVIKTEQLVDIIKKEINIELNKCLKCGGLGYTAEHDPVNCACGDMENPAVACPIQVQCEACSGTGKRSGYIINEYEKEYACPYHPGTITHIQILQRRISKTGKKYTSYKASSSRWTEKGLKGWGTLCVQCIAEKKVNKLRMVR